MQEILNTWRSGTILVRNISVHHITAAIAYLRDNIIDHIIFDGENDIQLALDLIFLTKAKDIKWVHVAITSEHAMDAHRLLFLDCTFAPGAVRAIARKEVGSLSFESIVECSELDPRGEWIPRIHELKIRFRVPVESIEPLVSFCSASSLEIFYASPLSESQRLRLSVLCASLGIQFAGEGHELVSAEYEQARARELWTNMIQPPASTFFLQASLMHYVRASQVAPFYFPRGNPTMFLTRDGDNAIMYRVILFLLGFEPGRRIPHGDAMRLLRV